MALVNPYAELFAALPAACRRDVRTPLTAADAMAELSSPSWLAFKNATAGAYAWAVPTEAAIAAIGRHAPAVVEIGAGSGYWAWLMRQAGIAVVAYDLAPAAVAWTSVLHGDADMAAAHPDKALFLCWPPWGAGMASRALAAYGGPTVIYAGEWMGGAAEPAFFARLQAEFVALERVVLPQWAHRDDALWIFRRRG